MEKKKWYIRIMESGYNAGDTTYEGTLEEARKYAEEWAADGDWLEPVVEVDVEIWDADPYEVEDAELVDIWGQYSYDHSKPDPYREAGKRYEEEHKNDECPTCGREEPEIHTPGLGGMDKYLEWQRVEPHTYLAWCRCPCGAMWDCVGEEYVEQVAKEMGEKDC